MEYRREILAEVDLDGQFHGTRIAVSFFVAKKFHASEMVRPAVDSTTVNWRTAMIPLSGRRVPPRVRTIPALRRRLRVAIISDPPEPVIIRHVRPNLGTPANNPIPAQGPRV